jgi:hypothetical protein
MFNWPFRPEGPALCSAWRRGPVRAALSSPARAAARTAQWHAAHDAAERGAPRPGNLGLGPESVPPPGPDLAEASAG